MNTEVCSIYYLGLQSAESNEACLDQENVLYRYLQKKQPSGRSGVSGVHTLNKPPNTQKPVGLTHKGL